MSLTPAEVDRLVDTHFMFEATDDVEGVLASLAPGAEHHVVPSPFGVVRDSGRIREFYATMFGDLKGESVTPVRRLYGDGFAVDEAIWNGQIEDGRLFGCEGKKGPGQLPPAACVRVRRRQDQPRERMVRSVRPSSSSWARRCHDELLHTNRATRTSCFARNPRLGRAAGYGDRSRQGRRDQARPLSGRNVRLQRLPHARVRGQTMARSTRSSG